VTTREGFRFGTIFRSRSSAMTRPFTSRCSATASGTSIQPLAASGVQDVTLAASFHWEKIAGVYGEAWQGLWLRYCVESEPAGTGGAIRQAMREAVAREALVLNGDTLLRLHFEHDVLAPGAQNLRLYAMETDGMFIDIGTPEDLARAGDLLR
jgi:NDP-sugar pyrophosphorylase family protein